jgi:hypothetical protein
MATEWLEVPTASVWDCAFAQTGIRWSELLRLPYWDPTCMVVVNAMHNLFLCLVKFHICTVLGINVAGDADGNDTLPPTTPWEMIAARTIWAEGINKANQLQKVKMPALLGLCTKNKINVVKCRGGGHLYWSDLLTALIVSSGLSNCGIQTYI